MFGGNWTEDLWVMAFSGKLEGLGLAFNDKMQPMWMAESGTVTHMLDRMLGLYPTKAPVTNAMELMSELKPGDKTCTEHFQYLVPLNVTCKDTAVIRTVVDGVIVEVNLTDVFYCKEATSNIISYASLEREGHQPGSARHQEPRGACSRRQVCLRGSACGPGTIGRRRR
ncbi:hypothetical protein PR002_g10130 [Phytophthora rubi]|uniref:Uncharacterized protein n=1 Tax=Phytophthora rubi TaxID=129364 RepID=A0A6A3MJD0_9STRA|nr:hypothetical protein PR002_g10130 [Phytophthora rubi]